MAGYRTGLTLTLPEFDTNGTLKRFASEHTPESHLAYLWLRRRAQNALNWQVLQTVPLELLGAGLNLRVGAHPDNTADAKISPDGKREFSLKELADMPRDQQMDIYLNACRQAGVDVSKLQLE